MEELCIVSGFNMKILYKWVVNILKSVKCYIFSLIAEIMWEIWRIKSMIESLLIRAKACGCYKSVSASLSGVIFNVYHTVIH